MNITKSKRFSNRSPKPSKWRSNATFRATFCLRQKEVCEENYPQMNTDKHRFFREISCLFVAKTLMKIAIVKYNAGNIESVKNALNRLNVEPILTDDAETLKSADKIIFPGVGEASSAMKYLREKNLDAVLKSLTQPVLGICLGMQLVVRVFGRKRDEMFGDFAVSKFANLNRKI